MKKKQVEKLINKIDLDNNFEKLNKEINYSKYVNENKKVNNNKINPFAMVICSIAVSYAIFMGVLAINHLHIKNYNEEVLNRSLAIYDLDNKSLLKINNKEDYATYIDTKILLKESYVDKILSFVENKLNFLDKNTNYGEIYKPGDDAWEGGMADSSATEAIPGDTENNQDSYQTNVQESGIDESDVSKCDGRYIYTFNYQTNKICVFDLNADMVTYTVVNEQSYSYSSAEIYVSNDDVILMSYNEAKVYSFDGSSLTLKDTFSYRSLIDSRLVDNTLYFVASETLKEENIDYDNLYYDGISSVACIYNVVKYDLTNNTYNKVKCLNSYSSNLYMSENNIYFSTTTYVYKTSMYKDYDVVSNIMYKYITSIAVFDYDLNPVGTIKLLGSVLNQFSMDEHNNYLRVVSTDTTMPKEQLNAISIFDLATLQRVGYLNQGIGLDRQIVKSVRYDDDTCYVVTYENTDPLYEIDLTDVTSPNIVSIYKAPGWSNYLHTFVINGEKYLFGIGFLDDRWTRKISIYKNDEQTTQIGKDFLISDLNNAPDLYVTSLLDYNLNNHKALFIYNDGSNLYLGMKLTSSEYYILKVDVNAEDVVSVYKTIKFDKDFNHSRAYLIDGYIYITGYDVVHKEEF